MENQASVGGRESNGAQRKARVRDDKRRILFIANEPAGGTHLVPLAEALEDVAIGSFVTTCQEGLAALGQTPFDAVVFEGDTTREGIELLNTAGRRQPTPHRFLVAPPTEPKPVGLVGAVPQFLPSDADPRTLATAVRRTFRISDWTADPVAKRVICQIRQLPSHPTVYSELMKKLQSPEGDLEEVAMLIAQDPAMCAKMLKLVNSAFFGLSQEICSAFEAVLVLGIERTKSLILFTQYVSLFRASKHPLFSIDELWNHSLVTASIARWILQAETREAARADEAFTAGLLHDIGKLMLAANLPEMYDRALKLERNQSVASWQAEREALGVSHDTVAAGLLGLWGLPLQILEAIAGHHRPTAERPQARLLVAAIHVANLFAKEKGKPEPKTNAAIDYDFLRTLDDTDLYQRWRETCLGAAGDATVGLGGAASSAGGREHL